jgi:hypothetical protein
MLLRIVAVAAFATVALAKDQKSFSLFNVVTFKNTDCVSTSTSNNGARNGTCYTSEECSEKGGQAEGGCAMGFGTCCVFAYSDCAKEVSENCTYIRNANYPSATTASGTCAYKIKKCQDEVCSLRLDFETFNILAGTNSLDAAVAAAPLSNCRDTFVVSGLSNGGNYPTICGLNTGQHMFIDIGKGTSNGATLTFSYSADAGSRTFEIKVTQYTCGSPNAPPSGCLQWFTGTEGRLTTFNFAGDLHHLPGQRYNSCIRQEAGFCCVKYQVCSDVTNPMTLFNNVADPTMAIPIVDSGCSIDFLEIEGSDITCGGNNLHQRYCGEKLGVPAGGMLNSEICDCTAPFMVRIVTDTADAAEAGTMSKARGLCLDYVQEPCGINLQ